MNYTLIGMYDSPFVRRVGITMYLYELPYEHRRWSVFGDFDKVVAHNPLGRVPILVIDDEEQLIESQAIIDHLDEVAGPETALLPESGFERRLALKRTMVSLGICEKAVALYYETHRRDETYRDPAWMQRLEQQLHSGLDWVENDIRGQGDDRLDQAALTAAVMHRFVREYLPEFSESRDDRALVSLSQRLEATPAFQAVPFGE